MRGWWKLNLHTTRLTRFSCHTRRCYCCCCCCIRRPVQRTFGFAGFTAPFTGAFHPAGGHSLHGRLCWNEGEGSPQTFKRAGKLTFLLGRCWCGMWRSSVFAFFCAAFNCLRYRWPRRASLVRRWGVRRRLRLDDGLRPGLIRRFSFRLWFAEFSTKHPALYGTNTTPLRSQSIALRGFFSLLLLCSSS